MCEFGLMMRHTGHLRGAQWHAWRHRGRGEGWGEEAVRHWGHACTQGQVTNVGIDRRLCRCLLHVPALHTNATKMTHGRHPRPRAGEGVRSTHRECPGVEHPHAGSALGAFPGAPLSRDVLEGQGPRRRFQTRVGQAVGGDYQSGWGRLLSVTNAVGAGTCGQGEELGIGWGPGRGRGYLPPPSNASLPLSRHRSTASQTQT